MNSACFVTSPGASSGGPTPADGGGIGFAGSPSAGLGLAKYGQNAGILTADAASVAHTGSLYQDTVLTMIVIS